VKFPPVEEEETIDRRKDRRDGCTRRWVLNQAGNRLTFVGSERSDVDEGGHLGIVPCFCDHDAAVGMANEDHRAALGSDGAFRHADVVAQ